MTPAQAAVFTEADFKPVRADQREIATKSAVLDAIRQQAAATDQAIQQRLDRLHSQVQRQLQQDPPPPARPSWLKESPAPARRRKFRGERGAAWVNNINARIGIIKDWNNPYA